MSEKDHANEGRNEQHNAPLRTTLKELLLQKDVWLQGLSSEPGDNGADRTSGIDGVSQSSGVSGSSGVSAFSGASHNSVELPEAVEPLQREISHLNGKLTQLEKRLKNLEPIVETLFQKGVESLKADSPCCAARLFETLLSFEPDHLKAQLNLSVACSQMGDQKRAYHILESVLHHYPDNEIARENMKILSLK